MIWNNMTIGVYGISSQSGLAYFTDFTNKGYRVIGYARSSKSGIESVDAIQKAGGVTLERPQNSNHEESKFVPLSNSIVTNDAYILVNNADVIILATPSIYQEDAVRELAQVDSLLKRKVPIILSPSRTVASPYLWRILGEHYPIVCFSTCPYSCKRPTPTTSVIKRRKRTWVSSLEGTFTQESIRTIKQLFPQAAITHIPALTSLNNIGSVFHCATYLLNIDNIRKAEEEGRVFSFYMEGIAKRPEVGDILEQIDQVRLQIADKLGMSVFGLNSRPREDIWRKLTNGLRALEAEHEDDIEILRKIRRTFTEYLNNSVISAQHWLDITYGVIRIEGEPLSQTIGRTPTYQSNSVPQLRYIEEDIPTGLVPMESLAKYLNIDCSIITSIIDKYISLYNRDIRELGRNLNGFDMEDILNYLKNGIY